VRELYQSIVLSAIGRGSGMQQWGVARAVIEWLGNDPFLEYWRNAEDFLRALVRIAESDGIAEGWQDSLLTFCLRNSHCTPSPMRWKMLMGR
jgi:hypothetical protein